MVVGLLMLPFNANHLGASEYGLWMLAASIVAYFPVLDLGLGSAMERAVAHYRAERSPEAINEVASTLVFVFAATGLLALARRHRRRLEHRADSSTCHRRRRTPDVS